MHAHVRRTAIGGGGVVGVWIVGDDALAMQVACTLNISIPRQVAAMRVHVAVSRYSCATFG